MIGSGARYSSAWRARTSHRLLLGIAATGSVVAIVQFGFAYQKFLQTQDLADDPTVLEWTAQTGRILLTHDVTTLTKYAYERIKSGLVMPGVFEISRVVPLNRAIEDILLLAECSFEGEWEGQIYYLPL